MTITKTAVWQQWDNVGLEYLRLSETDEHINVDSVVIGFEENLPFRLHYQIRCDIHYQVQQVTLNLAGHSPITLTNDGKAHWFDKNNHPISSLDGCYDIDITATPFTNTLPIRRLDWQTDQNRFLDMVYIRVPEMTMERVTQKYTCLERSEQESVFEFRQQDFSAILPIDADGFVQNYPDLFRRLS